MAIYNHKSISEDFKVTLVDAYLPDRDELLKRAYVIDQEIDFLQGMDNYIKDCKIRFPGKHSDDDLFAHISYNTRILYRHGIPIKDKNFEFDEIWLLKPKQWSTGYELKNKDNLPKRRLLITLHKGYKFGEQTRGKVIDKSGLEIIAANQYKNLDAFKREADKLLYDISLPYIAPNVVAQNIFLQKGYDSIIAGE
jgi:hypothetical protein